MFGKRQPLKPRCSFCNQTEDSVGKLIASPVNDALFPPTEHFVYICVNCIAVCNQQLIDGPEETEGIVLSETIQDETCPVVLPNGIPLRREHY